MFYGIESFLSPKDTLSNEDRIYLTEEALLLEGNVAVNDDNVFFHAVRLRLQI